MLPSSGSYVHAIYTDHHLQLNSVCHMHTTIVVARSRHQLLLNEFLWEHLHMEVQEHLNGLGCTMPKTAPIYRLIAAPKASAQSLLSLRILQNAFWPKIHDGTCESLPYTFGSTTAFQLTTTAPTTLAPSASPSIPQESPLAAMTEISIYTYHIHQGV